jgi:predicted ArsR family transcriptional regulator
VSRWEPQFFSTTRGQIVALLRRAQQTVDDLAAVLHLTDNAVRAHLLRLERDGLVRQHGLRRGERRPSLVYELTPEAEGLFPKAYAPALARLLAVLKEKVGPEELRELAEESGRRLAVGRPLATGGPRERLQTAADLLSSLGGLAEVETEAGGRLQLRGFSCPLGELVVEHPELCALAEALVCEASGLTVHECCDRTPGATPRCRFVTEPSSHAP